MINAKITYLNNEIADTAVFHGAPSISAAVKASAADVAIAMMAGGIDATEGAACKYIQGDFEIDALSYGDACYEVIIYASAVKFARVLVDTKAKSMVDVKHAA